MYTINVQTVDAAHRILMEEAGEHRVQGVGGEVSVLGAASVSWSGRTRLDDPVLLELCELRPLILGLQAPSATLQAPTAHRRRASRARIGDNENFSYYCKTK
jgi:hypothetical protein